MELRYEVSPSEAGTVVDELAARGVSASLLNLTLGDERQTVVVEVSDDDQAAEVRDRMLVVASDAVEVEG